MFPFWAQGGQFSVTETKKISYLTIPYSKITKFSAETAGNFELYAELEIWDGSDPVPQQEKFNTSVNIYDVQSVIARHIG